MSSVCPLHIPLKTFQSNNELIPDGQLNSTTAYLLGLGPIPTLPQRGQRGIAVAQLQQALINSSISVKGGADGIFGGATAAAITTFQTSHGIKVTGVVNLTTAIALGLVPGSSTCDLVCGSIFQPARASSSAICQLM